MTIGLYGKIPAQGDFVRVNATDAPSMLLDRWMQEGLDALARASASLPDEPVYFLFHGVGQREALVGVFRPSRDSVGRSYPLCVFARTDAAQSAGRPGLVPVASARFLTEAANILAEAPARDAAHLTQRVRALAPPTAAEASHGDAVARLTMGREPLAGLRERLFGEAPPGSIHYAFHTLDDACRAVAGREVEKPGVTLDCPIASDVDLFAWLEFAGAILAWKHAPPSFFWCEGDVPRLLLSLGPPAAAILPYLAQPNASATKLWPLTPSRPDIAAASSATLSERVRQAVDSEHTTLEGMRAALGR